MTTYSNIASLWRPYRYRYVKKGPLQKSDKCPFCVNEIDDKCDNEESSLIVYRGKYAFAVLNLYPYNYSHVLLCPYRHVANYIDLTNDELLELSQLTQRMIKSIQHSFSPDAFNIGINQGEYAGAGIPTHIHQHLIPRWKGDTSFMTAISNIKIMPLMLHDVKKRLQLSLREN